MKNTVSLTDTDAIDVLSDCIINTKGYNHSPMELAFELWEILKDTSEDLSAK